jgi:hypothetical protein
MLKTIARWALVLALSFTGLVAAPQAANAVGCGGGGCTGKDPNIQGCSADATTVSSYATSTPSEMGYNTGTLYVELRHSRACRARWVRMTLSSAGIGCGGGWTLRARIRDLASGGQQIAKQTKDHPGGCNQIFTDMVGRTSASVRTEFCHINVISGNPQQGICKSYAWQ